MEDRTDVAPDTLSIQLTDGGIEVEYLDDRRVFYRGTPEPVAGGHETSPGKDVHVLVTDESDRTGVMTYVNERNTDAEILEDTGVGRVMLGNGEEATLFPGVTVSASGYSVEVEVDHELVDGRVFVFEEDQFGERSYELVAETYTGRRKP